MVRQLALIAAMAPGAALADRWDCTITSKCGASGMCVETTEGMDVVTSPGRIAVAGLPGLSDPAAIEMAADGAFTLRPPKAVYAAEGTAFDHMAVTFSGHCRPAEASE